MAKCVECSRTFDLTNEEQAEEWFYGHDCEVESEFSTCAKCLDDFRTDDLNNEMLCENCEKGGN